MRLIQGKYDVAPHTPWHFEYLDGKPVGAGLFVSQEKAEQYARAHGWTITETRTLYAHASEESR